MNFFSFVCGAMASSAVSSVLYSRDAAENPAETRAGAHICCGDGASFHEWEFRTRPRVAGESGDQYIEAMSKVCDGLRGDAFVAAREVGFENLCEIIDGRPFGIDTLINHLRRMVFPLTEHESKELFRQYHSPGNKFERFRVFLELISRFEFDFRRCEIFFGTIRIFGVFKVQSHTPCGCICACAVACLHPHNSNSNVVVSVTIHDDIYIYIYICKRCSKKDETFVEGHKHIHVRIHVHFHTHTHTHIHIHVHVHLHVQAQVQVHVRVRVRVRVRFFVFVLACCCCCRCGLLWLLCVVVVVVVVVEEPEEGRDKPNHVTTESLRSVPQDC